VPIRTETYEAVYEQYSAAIQWMDELGIKLSPGRTSHYERIVRHWKDAYKTASAGEGKEIYPDFVSSMFEVFDFVSVHKAFQAVPHDLLVPIVEKLRKAVNGPINAADETSGSTTARNFLFEAIVAAKAHRPDMGITAILDAKSDTGIRINGKRIWIECKRVTTPEKIASNIRKASSQLETLLDQEVGAGHRGIVAMDISKILNWGDHIFAAPSDDELMVSVDGMMDRFIEQHSQVWERIYERRHRKIIGTMIRFAFMASSEGRNILVRASEWAINPRRGIAASDEQIQRQLVTTLQGAP
jgi:hypothetical protein